jgi:hypothetical protein
MRKKTHKRQQRKPNPADSHFAVTHNTSFFNPADSLLKTNKKKDIELSEQELGKVRGGGTGFIHKGGPIKATF